jgi:uncharacterized DUF497 family protein
MAGIRYFQHNAVGNVTFAWDRRKAQSNPAKHGVSFEEAQTAFLDGCRVGHALSESD